MNDYDNALAIINKYQGEDKELSDLLEKVKIKIDEEDILFKSIYLCVIYIGYETYPSLKRFLHWLDENEVYYPKMEVKYFTKDNRGVVSKSKIFVRNTILTFLERRTDTQDTYTFITHPWDG